MATLHRGFSPSSILVLLLLLLVVISSASPVHEILSKYGFPPGLFPDAAKHYALSPHGDFVVALDNPCYVQLTEIFYYEKIISGKLEFGRISDLSGIRSRSSSFGSPSPVSPPRPTKATSSSRFKRRHQALPLIASMNYKMGG
ncbi:hypothetical protein J5N97_010982 [Dioscorea zingiberensis]|uniref:Uncharacterized protein n=1 Tax=Dioscorea zingiberensis TaxID=325984 RepID=A0A9D5HP50_9LILI|nr:hypothetical protein J5N97_010982 [Dioscorea zingiberensis]